MPGDLIFLFFVFFLIFFFNIFSINSLLIIHYYSLKDVSKDIVINESLRKLYNQFCPGPITFILKKKNGSKIHPLASAKLKTVAVRFPKHKIVRSILKRIKFPLAMPSANKSTSVSPVSAEDVIDEFKKMIKRDKRRN